jgi:hypothetical protein
VRTSARIWRSERAHLFPLESDLSSVCSVRFVDVNWTLLVALLAAVAAMVAWPIIQLRMGMIDSRFKPRLWAMGPVVSIVGVLFAFVVASTV